MLFMYQPRQTCQFLKQGKDNEVFNIYNDFGR